MVSERKIKQVVMLSVVFIFTLLPFGDVSFANVPESPETNLIEYQEDGFSVQTLTLLVGSTVTWRNNTETPLNLRGDALQNTIYFPLTMSGGPTPSAQQTSATEMGQTEPASPANGFETIVDPGGEFSYRINTIGRFQFMDLADPDSRGQIIVTPLTKIYRGDDGSALYLHTVGSNVYGFGEHPGSGYAYALSGLLGDNHISAMFWDIPKGTRMEVGDVLLHVSNDGAQLTLESGSAAIGANAWQEIAPGSFDWPPGMQPAGFQATTTDDLTGAFEDHDGSRYYIREAGDEIVWVGEAPAQPGERPAWVNVFIGTRDPQVVPGMWGQPLSVQLVGSFAGVPKGLTNLAGTYGVYIDANRKLDLIWPWVIQTYNVEPDYAVDWDIFESSIVDALDNKAIGYAYAIGKGQGLMRSDAGGSRLLSQDGGSADFTVHTQAQAFSTSKTMTAVALVKALYENNFSVDDLVAPFLPDCWTQGDGIDDLTFRELLNHTSGLTQPSNSDPYQLLKELIAAGRTGPPGYKYNNTAYGLMRYLIPFVTNEASVNNLFALYDCEDDSVEINRGLSLLFSDYLFDMLDDVGVEATFFKDEEDLDPAQVDLAYLYNRNFEWYQGIGPDFEGWLKAGAGYLATSVLDYRRFLGALDQGQILPEYLVESMYNGNLGFDGPVLGDAGLYYQKDGAATGTCGAGGKAQLMVYPSGIHAYIMINSVTDGNAAKWEYDYNHNGGGSDEIEPAGQASGDLPLAGDFDRDGEVDDVAVFRPSNQTWYYDYNHNGENDEVVPGWGASGDSPLAGDFDRDGEVDDVAVFRSSNQTWYYDYDHNGGTPDEVVAGWVESGDIPLAGDFDRDGEIDDVAVFRPSNQNWYFDYDHDGGRTPDEVVPDWGMDGDSPLAGDFDRDSEVDDVAVFRPSGKDWYYDYDHDGVGTLGSSDVIVSNWGKNGDRPLAGDFDRDGEIDDVAVFRPSTHTWYYDYNYDRSINEAVVSGWGKSGDIPIAGDFDRDGYIDDVGVFRPTAWDWYYDYDHDGVSASGSSDEIVSNWGKLGDRPLAGDFDRDGYQDDVAVFRPSNRTWYYDYDHNGGTSDEVVAGWGKSGDLPLAGDFDQDGYVDDVAVYRPSDQDWYYDYDHNGGTPDEVIFGWGKECDVPIGGDFDRDGQVDDVGVFRLTDGRWYYDYNHDGGASDEAQPAWGNGAGLPLAGDFDRDGQADDVGFYRNTGVNLVNVLKTAFDAALE